jgi:hypothetical protein
MLRRFVLPWQGAVQQAQTIPTECSLNLSSYFSLLDQHLQGLAVQRVFGLEFSDTEVGCTHETFPLPNRTVQ